MISVVCPVYNEEQYIGDVLDFFTTAKPADKEMIIVDGGSTDRTIGIISAWMKKYPSIHLIHNPDKFVPFALNKAILMAKGDVIVRLDAHTKYAPDYLEKIIEAFQKSGAPIVGGPMRAQGNTNFQKAVSYVTSSVFGIGNSQFHFESFEGFSDSVYLGAWKSDVFTSVGGFDEEMLRNQDDEFHYRAGKYGLKIYQDPAIQSTYFPRNDYTSLYNQYFEYGLFKPLVLKKVSAGFQLRHLIPAIFVSYLVLFPLCMFFPWMMLFLFAYLIINILFTVKSRLPFSVMKHIVLIYPVLHIAYGLGFIAGLKKIV
jgi:succinoglycan biosynthesis protein ExoA